MSRLWPKTSSDVPVEVTDAVAELERLSGAQPASSASIELMIELLPVLFAEPVNVSPPALSAEQVAEKLRSGLPLLRGERVRADSPAFERRWRQVCDLAGRRRSDAEAARLADAVCSGQLPADELIDSVLAGQSNGVRTAAEAHSLDPEFTVTVLRLALVPLFTVLNDALLPEGGSAGWQHGYCLVCGSWPRLGEHRGLEQSRFLRCGLCTADWEFPRLRCPFCRNDDHQSLGFFHVEDEGQRFRVATCDKCRGYVKTASTLAALDGPHLLATDAATLHLDLAAAMHEYSVPLR